MEQVGNEGYEAETFGCEPKYFKIYFEALFQFNGQEILYDAGKISHKVAQELAYKEYDKFRKKQDELYISDFDKFLEDIKILKDG